jgi:Ser/Thr protein kinase RdoA (MazF antagonist)
MLKLSQMNAFFQTMDADGHTLLIQPFLDHWPHDPGSALVLRASSNFTLRYTCQGQPRILRLTPAEQRTPPMLQAELDFLLHLAGQGLKVNRPLPSLAGRLVESAETPLGILHAVSFEYVQGEEKELDQLTPQDFSRWGQALGELHNASAGFSAPVRPDGRDLLEAALDSLPAGEESARCAGQTLLARLAALPVMAENYGLIHFDFELDNLLWQEGVPQVIDFDDCARLWLAADIAYALRDLFTDRASQVDLAHPSLLAFVAGYRRARPLPESELVHLPLFAALLNLLKFAELLEIINEPPCAGEAEWTVNLRHRLAGKVEMYRGDILQ